MDSMSSFRGAYTDRYFEPASKKDMVIEDWRMLELRCQCTCRGQRVALIPGLRKEAKGTWLWLKARENCSSLVVNREFTNQACTES